MKKRNSIIFSFLFFHIICLSQDTINYNRFISSIKKDNPLFIKANNLFRIGDAQYQASKGGYDPQLSGSFENKYFDTKNYYSIVDAKIKQPIYSSHSITAGYQYAQGAYVNPEKQTKLNGLPFFGLEFSLLQGLYFDKRRADLLKSIGQKNYYEAEKRTQINELLYKASYSYFDWVYYQNICDIYKYFLTLAKDRTLAIKALADIGEYASIDTIEANIIYQNRFIDLQSIAMETREKEMQLSTFIWDEDGNPSSIAKSYFFTDNLNSYFEDAKKIVAEYFQDDVLNHPAIEKYKAYQQMLDVDKRLKAELIKPKLDLSYNFLANNEYSSSYTINTNNYKWGANLSFPLYLRTSRNELKIAKINSENNLLEQKSKINEVNFEYDWNKKNTIIILNQISLLEKNVLYSVQLVESEKLKFNRGESSLFLLNNRESKLMEAQIKLADTKLKFIKNILKLIYLKGNLNYQLN